MTYPNCGGVVDSRGSSPHDSMRIRRARSSTTLALLLFGLLFGLAPPASAQNAVPAKSQQQGAWTTHAFPLGADPPDHAWLARGSARIPLLVDGPRGLLKTRRYLPAGRYELVLGEKTVRAQVGTAKQGQAAAARLDSWFSGAHDTFRELSATLERRGRFHLALRLAKREPHLGAFRGSFLSESWGPALMSARMDLAMFRRRVLLPPRPKALEALGALADALAKRRAAWEACLLQAKPGPDPGQNAAVEAVAGALLQALGRGGDLSAWREGPLGTPPPICVKGKTFDDSALGYSLTIPAGAEPAECRDPVDRLMFRLEGVLVLVRVLEYPGVVDLAALRIRLERDAFERWRSYKQLSAIEQPDGLRLEFAARLAFRSDRVGQTGNARILQWSRFPAKGQRAFLLIALRREGEKLPPGVAALFTPKAFVIVGGK
ncbi:MAG: hypothetical protein JKY65_21810 [Planctomycetes bacterium]|nr:hypothetical protein [Planctomycetota bacterium]